MPTQGRPGGFNFCPSLKAYVPELSLRTDQSIGTTSQRQVLVAPSKIRPSSTTATSIYEHQYHDAFTTDREISRHIRSRSLLSHKPAKPMATSTHPIPPPPILTHPSATPPQLITQGAEGLLYRTTYLHPSLPAALKYRPAKPYRHPLLDARLTKQRILAEARILARCRRDGVVVPAVYFVDEAAGCLLLEWIAGAPVRIGVNAWLGDQREDEVLTPSSNAALVGLMRRVGAAVGSLHTAGVVHGDLTTSNMMLRPRAGEEGVLEGEIVIIDFGLASQGTHEEERAVDLYVLERAFLSTHPRAEKLFGEVLEGYKTTFKGSKSVLKKLEDVRMRGRKRSMIG